MQKFSFILFSLALSALNPDNMDIPHDIENVSVTTDFNNREQGWNAAFSDYPQVGQGSLLFQISNKLFAE